MCCLEVKQCPGFMLIFNCEIQGFLGAFKTLQVFSSRTQKQSILLNTHFIHLANVILLHKELLRKQKLLSHTPNVFTCTVFSLSKKLLVSPFTKAQAHFFQAVMLTMSSVFSLAVFVELPDPTTRIMSVASAFSA